MSSRLRRDGRGPRCAPTRGGDGVTDGRLDVVSDLPLLIFDGDCGFCTSSAHWIERRWPHERAVTIAWQRLSTDRLREMGLSERDVTTQAWWVDHNETRGGERAVGAALEMAGGAWRPFGRFIGAPSMRWLFGPSYRLIARYRYRLPGATTSCRP